MGSTTRILIVSASTGSGHVRAADALRSALQLTRPSWKIEHVDVLSLAPRWVKLAYGGGFELLAVRAPRVWGGLYRWSDGPEGDPARWGTVIERTLFRPFHRLLRFGGWDACICTHFLPAQLASGRPHMPPFAIVVTDLTLHRYWAQPRVHRYFVANQTLADELLKRIPRARVDVTGIPVDLAFSRSPDRETARRELGFSLDRPVVLVLGGGLGVGIEASLHAVLRSEITDLQTIVICGRNTALRERLEAAQLGDHVHVRGFVSGIERYFAAADLVVSKPGGLTTAEALAMGRPLLLTTPLPGHEQGNIDVLADARAALFARTAAELERQLHDVFSRAGTLASLTAAAAQAGRANAALVIARAVAADLHREAAA